MKMVSKSQEQIARSCVQQKYGKIRLMLVATMESSFKVDNVILTCVVISLSKIVKLE